MAPPWGPSARALRIYCCAGAFFPRPTAGRPLRACPRLPLDDRCHIRIVARDGRPRGSSFTGGVAFRRGPPFRYLPLCCSARAALCAGRRLGAVRRFGAARFFRVDRALAARRLRYAIVTSCRVRALYQGNASRQDRIAARMLTDPLPTLPAMRMPLAYVCESARAACGRSFWRGIPALLCRYICATSTVLIATSPSVASSGPSGLLEVVT